MPFEKQLLNEKSRLFHTFRVSRRLYFQNLHNFLFDILAKCENETISNVRWVISIISLAFIV